MLDFLDLLFRGAILSGQAAALGGVAFVLLVLVPAARERREPCPLFARSFTLIGLGAAVTALALTGLLLLQLASLADESGWPIRQALATLYVRVSLARVLACAIGVVAAVALVRTVLRPWLTILGVAVLASTILGAWTSHAVARVADRPLLLGLDAIHQVAAAVWVGGLLHLIIAGARAHDRAWLPHLLVRFSPMALASAAVLVVAGSGMAFRYIDGVGGVLGTAYGIMVITKAALLGALLLLGAHNFLAVRRLARAPAGVLSRLGRFVEVELGLGFTVLFAAASLTTTPAAVDVVGAERATLGEVAHRFAPQWPRFTSPPAAQMRVNDPDAPRSDADRAWSEFNHHVSGVFVLVMGLMAMASRGRRGTWARNWPLVILGLAVFVALRSDPESWPWGQRGFWPTLADAEVLQHRLFVLIVMVFAVFERMVVTGRVRATGARLVFPVLCAVGSALLLAHSHAALNLKSAFLVEVTHVPLALLGLVVGWARWLEMRLPEADARLPGRLWPVALTLVGVLLLMYRES